MKTPSDTSLDEKGTPAPETPIAESDHAVDHHKLQRATRLLLEAVGEDPAETRLAETWQRRVPAMLTTLTEGRRTSAKPEMRTFPADTDELIVKSGIPLYSLCEHHLLPYHGVAHVAYRPTDAVVGLSKLTRYVRWHSRQLTMQETLTQDIAVGLFDELDAQAVIVETTATHLCEAMRGIETPSETTTQATAGTFTDTDRQQFRHMVERP